MWDILLYMCCFYWLMNKAVLAYSRAEYSQTGREKEQAESTRHQVAAEGDRYPGTLPVNHEPHGNAQNNKNGLI